MKAEAIIEGVLLAAGTPLKLTELAKAAELSKAETVSAIEQYQRNTDRGVTIVTDGRTAQLVTAPSVAPQVARFTQAELRGNLSPSALETLAIIAYRGPVTRVEIETVRGVQTSGPLRTLAIRGLIEEVGRRQDPGRPILYDTSVELLKHLGISDRSQLPQPPEETDQKLAALKAVETTA